MVGYLETKVALDGLTERLDEGWIEAWKTAEQRAVIERGDALCIYEVKTSNGECR